MRQAGAAHHPPAPSTAANDPPKPRQAVTASTTRQTTQIIHFHGRIAYHRRLASAALVSGIHASPNQDRFPGGRQAIRRLLSHRSGRNPLRCLALFSPYAMVATAGTLAVYSVFACCPIAAKITYCLGLARTDKPSPENLTIFPRCFARRASGSSFSGATAKQARSITDQAGSGATLPNFLANRPAACWL